MSEIISDAVLGKIIITKRAAEKMREHHLYHYEIIDTLKNGFEVKSLVPGLRQIHYRHPEAREIDILCKTADTYGDTLGGTFIISCWAREVR